MMYKQGDIVFIPIPFTDLTSSKKRPVLILSDNRYNEITDDVIVAAITSIVDDKTYTVKITKADLTEGTLLYDSCVRADKLYTLSQSIIIKKFGTVKNEILTSVIDRLFLIFTHD